MLRFTTKPTHIINGLCIARFDDHATDIGRNVRGLLFVDVDDNGEPFAVARIALDDRSDRIASQWMHDNARELLCLPFDGFIVRG